MSVVTTEGLDTTLAGIKSGLDNILEVQSSNIMNDVNAALDDLNAEMETKEDAPIVITVNFESDWDDDFSESQGIIRHSYKGTYTANYTFDEMHELVVDGRKIVFYDDVIYELNSYSDSVIVFKYLETYPGGSYMEYVSLEKYGSFLLESTEYSPVLEINGKTGNSITIDASDVGAVKNPSTATVGQVLSVSAVDENSKPTEFSAVDLQGGGTVLVDSELSDTSENPVQNKIITAALADKQPTGDYALKSEIPTKTSDITNDSGFLTAVPDEYVTENELAAKGYLISYTETDPTVPEWAKAALKPTYTAAEVGALPADTVIPSTDGLASENYVDTKVAELVNSAPETLDTLNELAEALGNDPNFATTVATQIGSKVDKVDGKGLSTNDYTTEEKTKLSGIAEGAEANVQSDWNVTDTTSDAYIANKPTIPSIDGLATETYVNETVAAINAVPSSTTDDNDKILSVVNGVPTWVTITNAEGVAY